MYASDLSFLPDACEVTGSLGPHDSSVKTLSLHHQGRYLLVVTSCDSVLWDTKSGCRYRTLSGGETVGVQDVSSLVGSALVYCQYCDVHVHVTHIQYSTCDRSDVALLALYSTFIHVHV